MRYIQRGIAPKKLADSVQVQTWTDQYLKRREEWEKKGDKGNAPRPRHDIYAAEGVCETLVSMSGGKCFYCESKLNIGYDKNRKPLVKEYEIDHYVEVAEKPEFAYKWENLYLACAHCNNKSTNKDIPNSEVLDPCSDLYPHEDHITFDGGIILDCTPRGARTIEKYKLGQLNSQRQEQLIHFYGALDKIRQNQIADGGRQINADEKKILYAFKAKGYPFSLMFSVILAKHNL